MDTWEIDEWFTKATHFFVYYEQYPSELSSPIYSDLDENWSSDSREEEELTLSIKALLFEIIIGLEMTFVILRLYFSWKRIPFFFVKIIFNAILYGEVDITDHNFSFIWTRTPPEWPQGIRPFHLSYVDISEQLHRAILIP